MAESLPNCTRSYPYLWLFKWRVSSLGTTYYHRPHQNISLQCRVEDTTETNWPLQHTTRVWTQIMLERIAISHRHLFLNWRLQSWQQKQIWIRFHCNNIFHSANNVSRWRWFGVHEMDVKLAGSDNTYSSYLAPICCYRLFKRWTNHANFVEKLMLMMIIQVVRLIIITQSVNHKSSSLVLSTQTSKQKSQSKAQASVR